MQAAYTFLRGCPPFETWNLPLADKVKFSRERRHETDGGYNEPSTARGRHKISIAAGLSFDNFLITMAHEMVHMRQWLSQQTGPYTDWHGPAFDKIAAQVCGALDFDLQNFIGG